MRTKLWRLFQAIRVLVVRAGPMVRIQPPPARSLRTISSEAATKASASRWAASSRTHPVRPAAHCLDRHDDPRPSVGTAGLDGFASALHAKNDANDALHLIEPLRVQVVGHLDVLMVLPGDLEGEARGREPYEPQPEVARIGVVIVGLDVADASVTVLELPLNDKIGVLVARQIEVIVAGVLAVERDLEVPVAALPDRYVFGVKSHGRWP